MIIAAALAAPLVGGTAVAAEATEPYADDTVIVKYRADVSQDEQAPLEGRTGVERTVDEVAGLDADVVEVEGDPAAVADELDESPKVAYAEPNYTVTAAARPNDARFRDQWGLHNFGQSGGRGDIDIDAPKGWSRAGLSRFPSSGGVRVAVIDSGIERGHPDLIGKIAGCVDYRDALLAPPCADDDGHGTHVAGILAANADNGRGVAGVAFNSQLLVCRALGRVGGVGPAMGSVSDVANCISWARRQGAKVISMSLDGPRSRTLGRAARKAWSGGRREGSVLVAAAGNSGDSRVAYPAGYRQVVSVAAVDNRGRRAGFSNRNRDVEAAGPGVDILSTYRGGYTMLDGTSAATPHVAGVAAHLWRLHRRSRADDIRRRLRRAVDDLGPRGRDSSFGYGLVNLAKAAR